MFSAHFFLIGKEIIKNVFKMVVLACFICYYEILQIA